MFLTFSILDCLCYRYVSCSQFNSRCQYPENSCLRLTQSSTHNLTIYNSICWFSLRSLQTEILHASCASDRLVLPHDSVPTPAMRKREREEKLHSEYSGGTVGFKQREWLSYHAAAKAICRPHRWRRLRFGHISFEVVCFREVISNWSNDQLFDSIRPSSANKKKGLTLWSS